MTKSVEDKLLGASRPHFGLGIKRKAKYTGVRLDSRRRPIWYCLYWHLLFH